MDADGSAQDSSMDRLIWGFLNSICHKTDYLVKYSLFTLGFTALPDYFTYKAKPSFKNLQKVLLLQTWFLKHRYTGKEIPLILRSMENSGFTGTIKLYFWWCETLKGKSFTDCTSIYWSLYAYLLVSGPTNWLLLPLKSRPNVKSESNNSKWCGGSDTPKDIAISVLTNFCSSTQPLLSCRKT